MLCCCEEEHPLLPCLQERRARYNKLSGPEKATLNLVGVVICPFPLLHSSPLPLPSSFTIPLSPPTSCLNHTSFLLLLSRKPERKTCPYCYLYPLCLSGPFYPLHPIRLHPTTLPGLFIALLCLILHSVLITQFNELNPSVYLHVIIVPVMSLDFGTQHKPRPQQVAV